MIAIKSFSLQMGAKDLADRFAAKACAILSTSGSFLQGEHSKSWVRTAALASGTALAIYSLNRILSIRALNHGTKAVFDWSKEVVLVTGGSGGIGGETVKRLAAGGTTVIVLDLIPLSYPACKMPLSSDSLRVC